MCVCVHACVSVTRSTGLVVFMAKMSTFSLEGFPLVRGQPATLSYCPNTSMK